MQQIVLIQNKFNFKKQNVYETKSIINRRPPAGDSDGRVDCGEPYSIPEHGSLTHSLPLLQFVCIYVTEGDICVSRFRSPFVPQ